MKQPLPLRNKMFNIRLSDSEVETLRSIAESSGHDSVSSFVRAWLADQAGQLADASTIAASRSKNYKAPKSFWRGAGGQIYVGDSLGLLHKTLDPESVDLIVTSPPFGLVKKKAYGNEPAHRYLEWFRPFAEGMRRVLRSDGSLVIDIGPAWLEGMPAKSLYQFELLTMLCKEYGFYLAQDFYWWNPSRMPAPAEWVNIRRLRVKDAVNPVWWLSPTPWPKASNKRVLTAYGKAQEKLFRNGYNEGRRPSGHNVSKSWGKDNGGAIPPNLIAAPNTVSDDPYQNFCREMEVEAHPARFPWALPEFFIKMLTNKGDLVVDPFAGSCMTGAVAHAHSRKWICCELSEDYLLGALGRFQHEARQLQAPSVPPAGYHVPPQQATAVNADLLVDSFGGKGPPAGRRRRKASKS